ncbi:hypothetical protein [Paraburkholderia elongata]|uniref:Uncharacterized protein n=1 Tax=Paraburkholderia elongata TaxID=2675747 RepID=A0A972NSN5_9BURK|nr:hypothetical protein [Paraburkholderia elongata]NPT59073.1 hypothetical protein [Paraburkholderia elongata]
MTPYPVIGFTRPAELYEFASNHGLHVGSMDKLERFAAALQQKAISQTLSADGPAIEVRVIDVGVGE